MYTPHHYMVGHVMLCPGDFLVFVTLGAIANRCNTRANIRHTWLHNVRYIPMHVCDTCMTRGTHFPQFYTLTKTVFAQNPDAEAQRQEIW